MEATLVSFLDALSSKVFWLALAGFVLLNGAALAGIVLTRSRRLVDQWTPKLLAADAVLVGAGLGIPLVSGLAKLGVHAVAAMFGGTAAPAE